MHEIINYLNQVDTSVFLYLNGFHNQYWDYFMTMYSSRFVWVPFYASFLYVMIRNLHIKVTIASLLVIVAIIFICDQTASTILKPMVERMRPSNLDNPISPWVHVAFNYRGGRYGFPSSHAANAWSMAFFAMYLVKRNKLTLFLFAWALLMTYSRIYLGVHYPGDLLVGTLIGFIAATASYYLYRYFAKSYTSQFIDTFPAGTLSGAPKVRAMQIISELEPHNRGAYGGCIGFIGLNGDLNQAIVIRTFISRNGELWFQAGSGVVAKSNDQYELEECNNKLGALTKAIHIAENL